MAKITNEERRRYEEKIKPYKTAIAEILKKERILLGDMKEGASTLLVLADEILNLTSNYIIINGICRSMLKVKNEESLNDARKALYKSMIYLEQVVSSYIDAPYADYEEGLKAIASMDAAKRYSLIRKMGFTLQLLQNAYGNNTKWRWAFVEMEGRFAVVAKNIIDLRKAVSNTDPRSPDYEPTMLHLALVKDLLSRAASRYRDRYELSTSRIDDFKVSIQFLSALKRFLGLMGYRNESEEVQKKLHTWSNKLELDMKKQYFTIDKKQE